MSIACTSKGHRYMRRFKGTPRLTLHSQHHFINTRKACPVGAGFSASTSRLQENLENFWYNHLHNKDCKEEPKEDKAADKKQLPPQGWSILLREDLPDSDVSSEPLRGPL